MSGRSTGLWSTLLLVCSACSATATPPIVRSLERSGAVAFLCRDSDGRLLDLASCDLERALADETAPRPLGLLTQVDRGQIATVDLASGRVLDADRRIPGYSFPTVLEAPVGVAVSPFAPRVLVVASGAQPLLEAYEPEQVLPGGRGERSQRLALPAPASALEVGPGGRVLLAPMPEAGAVALIPMGDDGQLGAPVFVEPPAPDELPAPVDTTALPSIPAPARRASFEQVCVPDDVRLPAVQTLPPGPSDAMVSARPVAVAFEPAEAAGRPSPDEPVHAWVADAARGALYRLHVEPGALDRSGVEQTVVLDAPVRALAVTPRVPAVGEDGGCVAARYLYAVDDRDGSLIAVDVSDEGSPSFGAVLPIGPASDPMRWRFGRAVVTALRVVAPDYPSDPEPCGALPWCDPAAALGRVGPDELRGVFVALGLSDGTVRIVDVLDLDAPCRGRPGVAPPRCGDPTGEAEVYVRRHRPRLGAVPAAGPSLLSAPLAVVDRIRGRVLPDGSPESGAPLRFEPFTEGCPEGSRRLFPAPEEGPAVLCVGADPWVVRSERWTLTWEGPLPGGRAGGGRLEDGRRFVVTDPGFDFCTAGVVGRDDVPDDPAMPEAGYGGDVLEVLGEPSEAVIEAEPACARFAGTEPASLRFAVQAAWAGEVVLGEALGEGRLEDLARCYPEGAAFRVRAREAFAVTGSRTPALHRVRVDEEGRCRVDGTLPATRVLRARFGRRFDNGAIGFVLAPNGGETLAAGSEATVTLDVGGVAPTLGADLCPVDDRQCSSSTPTSVRNAFGWLFVTDGGDRGLGGLRLQPFSLEQVYF